MAYDLQHARFETNCPVARVERGRFERLCDVSGGLRLMEVVAFESEILWVRKSTCQVVVAGADGRVVQDGNSYNDFYGFLTSMRTPLREDAESLSRSFDVQTGGRLRVEVRLIVEDVPTVVDERQPDGVFSGNKAYHAIPGDWCRAPSEALAEWVARRKAGTLDRFETPIERVEPVGHAPVVLFDSSLGLDVAEQARGIPGKVEAFLADLPADKAEAIRGKVVAFVADLCGDAKAVAAA